ncbi:MAG: hypothetical protein Kow00124_08540 [Anaerolineae bacterium]
MTASWIIQTKGEPLPAIQTLLTGLLHNARLDVMLVPVRAAGPAAVKPAVVTTAEGLVEADPFAPLMTVNAARLVVDYTAQNPGKRLGAVLRACEVRALLEVAEYNALDLKDVLIIGVDCVGTFTVEDFAWRGTPDKMTDEVLRFARQGGVAGYRYRPACQMCVEPMPDAADLTIDLLGLPARKVVMITAHNPRIADDVNLPGLTDGEAPPDLIQQHEEMRQAISARRARTRERILKALREDLAMDVEELVAHLQGCESCRACMDACPIYGGKIGQDEPLTPEVVIRWLGSCAGCGMCEAACPRHLPLTAIFTRIHDELARQLT